MYYNSSTVLLYLQYCYIYSTAIAAANVYFHIANLMSRILLHVAATVLLSDSQDISCGEPGPWRVRVRVTHILVIGTLEPYSHGLKWKVIGS